MRIVICWSETAAAVDNVRPPITSLVYSPSGDQIIAACGTRVLMYAAANGNLLRSLQAHEDTVYCVEYASDGQRFASGGADCTVFVWDSKGEGIVKYRHKASIQALSSCPTSKQIASVSSVDWTVWAPDIRKVVKRRLPAKGLCAKWTPDGQVLAIGVIDGTVLLLSRGEEEKARIQRKAPVWTLGFNPLRENGADVLVLGSWDQRLSFYNLDGTSMGKEAELDFDPCSLSFYDNGEYLIVNGSDHKVNLYTKEGNRLLNVVEAEGWIWCAQQRPNSRQICCGTNEGTITCVEMNMTNVHSIYHHQYVYRENLTNVVVHQLLFDRKMKIPCNDYVCKLATFRDRMAVQFQEKIVIFELFYDDERNMHYQDIAQIRKRLECTLMCVTSNAVILCKDRRITKYDFQGNKRREWLMDSALSFIKVDGGQEGREALLLGLQNGQVFRIFVDNPFPTLLVKVNAPIRCVDLSSMRQKIAIVDDNKLLQIFDLTNKCALLFSETNSTSVAWSKDTEEIIAYTTKENTLNIRTDTLPAYQQSTHGLVVDFKSNRVFTLHDNHIIITDVPHAHALYRYIEAKQFDLAYRIACLGVTESDWKMLGMHAMTNLELDIARKAFTHIHEVKLVELLTPLELQWQQQKEAASHNTGESSAEATCLILGDISAFRGNFQEAVRQYIKANHEKRAIEMFCSLKMWEEARKVCSNENHMKDLVRQQAQWAEDSEHYAEAASLYETSGNYRKAISMMCKAGQVEKLMQLCRKIPKSKVGLITQCAEYFVQNKAMNFALEAYEKIDDNSALINIYVGRRDWRNAFAVLDRCPNFAKEVYLPWASWLADNDKFDEALMAFQAVEDREKVFLMLEALSSNSVTCRKFRDAAFYYTHIGNEWKKYISMGMGCASNLKLMNTAFWRADMYYAFSFIYTQMTQPFPFNELRLFRIARYLLVMVSDAEIPMNIGKAEILCTLARSASRLNMMRTARAVFDKLNSVILPLSIQQQADIESLLVRSREFTDREELLDMCYRCKHVVPLFAGPGDCCPNCYHPFVRSFVNFEVLPLVEFTIANDFTMWRKYIIEGAGYVNWNTDGILPTSYLTNDTNKEKAGVTGEGKKVGDADIMKFDDENIDYQIDRQLMAMGQIKAAPRKSTELFTTQLQHILRPGRAKGAYEPFVVNEDIFKKMKFEDIFVKNLLLFSDKSSQKYYLRVTPDVHIAFCSFCQHFFNAGDYEHECMKGSGCPVCRQKPGKQTTRSLKDVMLEMEEALK